MNHTMVFLAQNAEKSHWVGFNNNACVNGILHMERVPGPQDFARYRLIG